MPLKPLGIFNAAKNELTTPKSAFGTAISQLDLSTNSLKPQGLTTPEKAPSQQANPLLERQIHRAEFQQQVLPKLTWHYQHQRIKPPANGSPKVSHEPKKTRIETEKSRRQKAKTQR
ncbi:hypothetical protein [Vibrio diabolicus]|uniref:hypothetical protein n=1 Tax=Vibrio diabolicus TaxID=50719 RepID=UPI0015F6F698|nr:hypothetical protein [Vibrio diabolicus]